MKKRIAIAVLPIIIIGTIGITTRVLIQDYTLGLSISNHKRNPIHIKVYIDGELLVDDEIPYVKKLGTPYPSVYGTSPSFGRHTIKVVRVNGSAKCVKTFWMILISNRWVGIHYEGGDFSMNFHWGKHPPIA